MRPDLAFCGGCLEQADPFPGLFIAGCGRRMDPDDRSLVGGAIRHHGQCPLDRVREPSERGRGYRLGATFRLRVRPIDGHIDDERLVRGRGWTDPRS